MRHDRTLRQSFSEAIMHMPDFMVITPTLAFFHGNQGFAIDFSGIVFDRRRWLVESGGEADASFIPRDLSFRREVGRKAAE